MVVLYFSGTGNSKYIADSLARAFKCESHSIEEDLDFSKLIGENKTIGFSYPIYGSCLPKIMTEFILSHRDVLVNKKLIILSTQMMFSGDGAKEMYRLIPKNKVIYGEHFNMPNNISNTSFLPITNFERNRKKKKADKKMKEVVINIRRGKIVKTGWSNFSTRLGLLQRNGFPEILEKKKSSFTTTDKCVACGKCVDNCPVKNLSLMGKEVIQHDKCILCYRCVNICPKKAACVLLKQSPKRQYKGVE